MSLSVRAWDFIGLRRFRCFGQLLAYGVLGLSGKRLATIVLVFASFGAVPARAEVTIAALGDSLTQGYGLPQDDGFVPRLQAWLHENGAPDVVLINAGVSGDTSAGGAARIGWTLGEDVDAVIVALGANDLLRGIDPAETRANLDAILTEIDARSLPAVLVGMPAPNNFGPEYKAEFDAIFPTLAEKHRVALYPFFFSGFGTDGDFSASAVWMQDDGLHPNSEGVLRIVSDIGPMIRALADTAR